MILNQRIRDEVIGGMMRTLFSDRYVRKFGLPQCCIRKVNRTAPPSGKKPVSVREIMEELAEDEDDSDEEFWKQHRNTTVARRKHPLPPPDELQDLSSDDENTL